jgi:hypothetical protein
MKMNHGDNVLPSLFKWIDDMHFTPCPCFETGAW